VRHRDGLPKGIASGRAGWFHRGVLRLGKWLSAWSPVLICMGLIFFASGDVQSKDHSSRLVAPLVHWLWPTASASQIEGIVLLVRTGAHLTEYAILAALCWRALRLELTPPRSDRAVIVGALLIVVAYAASDEYHQTFVPDRYGCVADVMIDSTGGSLGLGVLVLAQRWRHKIKRAAPSNIQRRT